MITRIFIDNYRCFTNFEFEPKRLNFLMGANGSGKSSFFDLTEALARLVVRGADLSEVFPTSSLTRWDSRSTQRVELEAEVQGKPYRYVLIVQHDREHERAVIRSEEVTSAGKTLFAFDRGTVRLHDNSGAKGAEFHIRGDKSFIAQIEDRPATKDLLVWREFIEKIWTVRLNTRGMSGVSRDEEATLARSGSNFASWYRHLTQERADRLPSIWSSLEAVLPGFRSLKLVSAGGKGRLRELVARMTACGADYDIDFDELSDGQRTLIVLYTLLEGISPGEGALLLDEPEIHVGISEIQPWLVELDSRFESHGQFFLASQNPEVVDYMAASHPFLFERPDGGPARVRPAIFDHESGLSAASQLARGLADGC